MVLVFCRGGEVAGRERGEGVLDQKRERERSTSQHENRLVPRLLKPHSHHDLCSLYSLPTGLVGPTALWGWIMFLPDRKFYNGGNIHSRHGINRSTVQTDDYDQKLQNIDGGQQSRLQRVMPNNHFSAATRPPPEYSQIPDRPLCIPSLCDHKWLRVSLLDPPASITSAAIPLRLETCDSSTAAFDAL